MFKQQDDSEKVQADYAAIPGEPNLLSQHSVTAFGEKLARLSEMGWKDRCKNISTLVHARGDIVAAVQCLLDEASAQH